MSGEHARLIYAIVLAVIGLTLVTARNTIAKVRNRHSAGRWGAAEPRRYLIFGVLFIFLAIASLVWK
jgi:hypothetical protein